jgi:hypothetical protein
MSITLGGGRASHDVERPTLLRATIQQAAPAPTWTTCRSGSSIDSNAWRTRRPHQPSAIAQDEEADSASTGARGRNSPTARARSPVALISARLSQVNGRSRGAAGPGTRLGLRRRLAIARGVGELLASSRRGHAAGDARRAAAARTGAPPGRAGRSSAASLWPATGSRARRGAPRHGWNIGASTRRGCRGVLAHHPVQKD